VRTQDNAGVTGRFLNMNQIILHRVMRLCQWAATPAQRASAAEQLLVVTRAVPSSSKVFVEEGAHHSLAKILSVSSSELSSSEASAAAAAAAAALSCLVTDAASAKAVSEADFLGPLIALSSGSSTSSSSSSSSSSSAAAAAALAKLSTWNPDIKEILCEEGGMQAIAHMCDSADPSILKFAAETLVFRAGEGGSFRDDMISPLGCEALRKLIKTGDSVCQVPFFQPTFKPVACNMLLVSVCRCHRASRGVQEGADVGQ